MLVKRGLAITTLATLCLTTALFATIHTIGSPVPYDPWFDVNEDGVVDLLDLVKVTGGFGAVGTPICKASLVFDSGWRNITNEPGQYYPMVHNLSLSSTEAVVDARGLVPGWNKTYGGTYDESADSLVQTGDGGYALAGYTVSFGAWQRDVWLVKTDANGNAQWTKTYGGTNHDSARSIVQTGDGGYALAGYTWSFGAGGSDFWLVKTDANGNAQWTKTYGGTDWEAAFSLVQTGDGGYAIAGNTLSLGADDFWLVKTEVESGLAWTDFTADTITLHRGSTDPCWNYVRVRIWKIKETP